MLRLLYRTAILLVAAGALGVATGCGGDDLDEREPAGAPLRILFVGNSPTATNDLPAVSSIADEAGRRPIVTETVAPGGVSLEEHWSATGAREALASGAWDYVVLQQGPSSLPESKAHLRRWAVRWAKAIRARGARPALLEVWPEDDRRSAFADVVDAYARAAAAARAELLPAGAAWLAAWKRDPGLELYGPDGFHPSEFGTSLAALVAYAGLTGVAPSGLPVPGDPDRVGLLRTAAAESLASR